jgi:glutathione S-transferase
MTASTKEIRLKLYYFPGACSLADHIVLKWTGIEHTAIRLDREALKSPEYLALNPNGTVPLLVDGDFRLTENAAILHHVAEARPEAAPLGEHGHRARAEVARWTAFLNSDLHGAFKPIFAPTAYFPDEAMADVVVEQARKRVVGFLQRIDDHMEGRDWLAGTRSIADPYLFVMLRWANGTGIPVGHFDNLQRFLKRMQMDDGVRAAIFDEEGPA